MAAFGDVLRNLGSVLNPNVERELAAQDQSHQTLANQIGLMKLQQQIQMQSPQAQAQMIELEKKKRADAYFQSPRAQQHLANPDQNAGLRGLTTDLVGLGIQNPVEFLKEEVAARKANRIVVPRGATVFENGAPVYTSPSEPKAPPIRKIPEQVGNQYFEVTQEMGKNGQWTEVGRRPLRDPTFVMPRQPHYVQGVDQSGNINVIPIEGGRAGAPISTDLRPAGVTTSGNQQALALRREFNNNPEVKLTNALEPKVGPMAQYVAEVGKGQGNAVGDAELVKLWLMTTHPKGDQISNLDWKQIERMPDLWGRVKNVAGNFVFGKTLDSETRADMWKSISEKYKSTAAMRDRVKNNIVGRAKQMRLDEAAIFR